MIREIEEAIADYRGDVQAADLRLRERLRAIADHDGPSSLGPDEEAPADGPAMPPSAASSISRRRGIRADGAATRSATSPTSSSIDPEGQPAPASRRGRGEKGLRPAGAPVTPAPALRTGEVHCPECDKPFDRRQALGSHRYRSHGVRGVSEAPARKPRIESWVCSSCPRTFPTRQERDDHQAGHPPVEELKPVGRNPQKTRVISGSQIA